MEMLLFSFLSNSPKMISYIIKKTHIILFLSSSYAKMAVKDLVSKSFCILVILLQFKDISWEASGNAQNNDQVKLELAKIKVSRGRNVTVFVTLGF